MSGTRRRPKKGETGYPCTLILRRRNSEIRVTYVIALVDGKPRVVRTPDSYQGPLIPKRDQPSQ